METSDGCKRLLAAYRAMEPVREVVSLSRALGGGSLSTEAQEFFLRRCLLDEVCRLYPPEHKYRTRVLKDVILAAEQDGEEVADELYQQLTTSLRHSSDVTELATKCYRTYAYDLPKQATSYLASIFGCEEAERLAHGFVTLRVSQNMLEADTGCWAWPAGFYLAEFLMSFPPLFTNKTCLELGSGAGMAGICLSRLAPSKVILSDGDLGALKNLRHNLEVNGVICEKGEPPLSKEVFWRHVAWETVSDETLKSFQADVILGSDVVYNPECIVHLVRVLKSLLCGPDRHCGVLASFSNNTPSSPARPVAYLASVARNKDTMSTFLKVAGDANLDVRDVTEKMKPDKCLVQLTNYDRSAVVLHQISAR